MPQEGAGRLHWRRFSPSRDEGWQVPTDTFFNLPEAKRERIIDAALDEFAHKSYNQASLSQIVNKAGIAKGSMYQYFTDKFDLYLHLIGMASELKLAALRAGVADLGPDADVFDMLRVASQAGMAAIRANPRINLVGNRMLAEGPEFLARVVAHFGSLGEDTVGAWLRASIDRGLIDRRINPRVAGFLINAVLGAIGQETAAGRLPQEQAAVLLDQLMDIVKYGMKPRDGGGEGGQDPR